jgi:hypothetical protein
VLLKLSRLFCVKWAVREENSMKYKYTNTVNRGVVTFLSLILYIEQMAALPFTNKPTKSYQKLFHIPVRSPNQVWVDTHVWHISIRLGLIGKKVTADAAHDLLQALLPQDARIIYNFHKALLRHGQRICVYDRPRCEKCPITDLCDYYQTVVKPQ